MNRTNANITTFLIVFLTPSLLIQGSSNSAYSLDTVEKQLTAAQTAISAVDEQIKKAQDKLGSIDTVINQKGIANIKNAQKKLMSEDQTLVHSLQKLNSIISEIEKYTLHIPVPGLSDLIKDLKELAAVLNFTHTQPIGLIKKLLKSADDTLTYLSKQFDENKDPKKLFYYLKEAASSFEKAEKTIVSLKATLELFDKK
ncbi:MAG: hypothetical protein WBQ73_00640 [Candidatus Babeliales bacterium]